MIADFFEKIIFKIKNKSDNLPRLKYVFLFSPVFLYLFISLTDTYLLPSSKENDVITSYKRIYSSRKSRYGASRKVKIGYEFFTNKGKSFKTHDQFIQDPYIELKSSLIFGTVTSVSNSDRDYSDFLFESKGIILYLKLILLVSLGVSIFMLLFKENISENAFLNIRIFNIVFTIIVILSYFVMS